MDQPQREPPENEEDRSDLRTSGLPGGPGQKEQEPGRARTLGNDRTPRPDGEIRAELDAMLGGADDFDPSAVDLMVSDGIVVMLGSVPDYQVKRRLHALCSRLAGVREIHDQLQVSGEMPSETSEGLRMEAPRAGFRGPGS